MPFSSKERNREYQRSWAAKRRAEYIATMGGRCRICGSVHNLEIDHIDRSTKTSHKIWTWSRRRIEEELKKCQLLCETGHETKTTLEVTVGHGGGAKGLTGCKCEKCREARRRHSFAYMRKWRAEKK